MGWFPIFPWLVFPIIGLLVGKYFTQASAHQFLLKKLSLVGVFLILCAFLMAIIAPKDLDSDNIIKGYITSFCFYPNTTSMLLLQLGITITIFGILVRYFDTLVMSKYLFLRYCNLISRYSLSIFVLHFLILFWPLRIAGYLEGNIHKYIANVVSPSMAILIGFGIFIFLSIVVKIWDKYGDGKYSLEWILAKIKKH